MTHPNGNAWSTNNNNVYVSDRGPGTGTWTSISCLAVIWSVGPLVVQRGIENALGDAFMRTFFCRQFQFLVDRSVYYRENGNCFIARNNVIALAWHGNDEKCAIISSASAVLLPATQKTLILSSDGRHGKRNKN